MNWAKRPDYLDCMNPKAANTDPQHKNDPSISQIFM